MRTRSAERGAVTVTRRFGQVYRGSIALTGDRPGVLTRSPEKDSA